jgi:hypothetical protein
LDADVWRVSGSERSLSMERFSAGDDGREKCEADGVMLGISGAGSTGSELSGSGDDCRAWRQEE